MEILTAHRRRTEPPLNGNQLGLIPPHHAAEPTWLPHRRRPAVWNKPGPLLPLIILNLSERSPKIKRTICGLILWKTVVFKDQAGSLIVIGVCNRPHRSSKAQPFLPSPRCECSL